MKTLEMIGADNWDSFVQSPFAVLMLGKTDCQACTDWTAELSAWLEADEGVPEARYGKLLLDQRGLIGFKKAFPWLADVDVLPFNAIFRSGEKVKDFAGGGLERLKNRLARLAEEATGTP